MCIYMYMHRCVCVCVDIGVCVLMFVGLLCVCTCVCGQLCMHVYVCVSAGVCEVNISSHDIYTITKKTQTSSPHYCRSSCYAKVSQGLKGSCRIEFVPYRWETESEPSPSSPFHLLFAISLLPLSASPFQMYGSRENLSYGRCRLP